MRQTVSSFIKYVLSNIVFVEPSVKHYSINYREFKSLETCMEECCVTCSYINTFSHSVAVWSRRSSELVAF